MSRMNYICTHTNVYFGIFHDINTIIQFIIEVDNRKKIIFFIENLSHFRFVKPLFDYFLHNNFKLKLLCIDNPFETSVNKHLNLEIVKFKNNTHKIKVLKNLNGDMFFTTTPSIGSPVFPKSKIYPKESRPSYIYLFHSLVSPNEMYIKNSFKNFDVIFSPSETISKQLVNLVSRNTEILTSGYLLFNNIDKYSMRFNKNNKVLVAPTWGKEGVGEIINNIYQIYDFNSKFGYETVFRPHPMTELKKGDIGSEIILDLNLDLKNLHEYEHLITDYSGIALEYAYLTGRSILFLDVKKKIKRKVGKLEASYLFIEDEMRTTLGEVATIDDLSKLKRFPEVNQNKYSKFINSINTQLESLEKTIDYLKKF